jgi:hypothetical protein
MLHELFTPTGAVLFFLFIISWELSSINDKLKKILRPEQPPPDAPAEWYDGRD